MAFGLILIFVGLLAAFLGALFLISDRSSSPTAKLEKTDNSVSAKAAAATSQGPTLATPEQSTLPSPGRSAPTGTQKIIVEGLTKARSDLLSIKKGNLTCAALSEWQNGASATTRLAHATGIGIHNPISNYLGACQGIADVEKLEAIRDSVAYLLKRGIDAAGGQSSTVNGPINGGIGMNNGTVNNLLPSAPSQTPAMRQTTLILQDAVSKCMNRDGMPGDDATRRKWLEPCINDLLASQGQPWKYEATTDLFIKI